MPELVGIPGVKEGRLDVLWFRTASGAMRLLKKSRAVTTAGDHGALSAYVDDDGNYRAEVHCYMITKASLTTGVQAELRRFIEEWLPQIKGGMRQ